MGKIMLLLLALKVLMEGRGKAATTEPPAEETPPAWEGGYGVAVRDLLPGEPAGAGPPTPNFPDGVPLPPPAPSPAAAGYDGESWRDRYPNGPPAPGSAGWPGERGYRVAESRDPREERWAVWVGDIDWWSNPVNAALRADLATHPAFADLGLSLDWRRVGDLDAVASEALRTLWAHAPVPPVEPPWRGCAAGTRPAWEAAEDLIGYRERTTLDRDPEDLAETRAIDRLRELLRSVRRGELRPMCSTRRPAELNPHSGAR